MATINLGKVVPEKGVDYYTEQEKNALVQEIENDIGVSTIRQNIEALQNRATTDEEAITTLQTNSGSTIEMTLNTTTYVLTIKLKNRAGEVLNTQTVDLPNENAITGISYANNTLTLTKQSGETSTVDISGVRTGLVTETTFNTFVTTIQTLIGVETDTYDTTETYNTGDIVVKSNKIYKAKEDNITGTFDSTKWDEISVYEYQKIQDEETENNYKEIIKLQEELADANEQISDLQKNTKKSQTELFEETELNNSADSRIYSLDAFKGNTVQKQYTGKNILQNIYHANDDIFTDNGITFTKNSDGSIIANGTSTANAVYWFVNDGTSRRVPIEAGTYILSGAPAASGSYITWGITDVGEKYDEGSGRTVTISSDTTYYLKIVISSGKTVNNLTFYPMLRLASITDDTYEPYVGGTASPNPDYPQEIYNCTGSINEKIENKNLAIVSTNLQPYGATVTTTVIRGDDTGKRRTSLIKVKPSTNYVLSKELSSSNFRLFYYDEYPTFNSTTSIDGAYYGTEKVKAITTPATAQYLFVQWTSDNDTSPCGNVQIEEGSTATSYEPYKKQESSFPLTAGQVMALEDYLADDGIHHVMGEKVFDGSVDENWNFERLRFLSWIVIQKCFLYYN